MSVLLALAPALALVLLLWCRRYPGESRILAARRGVLARHRRAPVSSPTPRAEDFSRRADTLLALALAGRAPPALGVSENRHHFTGGKMKSKPLKVAALASAAALLAPALAQAHISLNPNTIPAGAFATLDVRVPGEQEGAYVTKVDVLFPKGFTGVDYENVPGWSTKVIEEKLATPIKEGGETIDTEVSQIVWTWTGPLGKVNNAQFVNFPLSLAIPEGTAGKALEFKTVQSYSNGQVVHWIDPTLTAEHPAPRVNVTAKGGVIEDVAGHEAGPEAGQTGQGAPATPAATVTKSSGGASKGLAIAALVVGALGLLAALGALALALGRRRVRGGA